MRFFNPGKETIKKFTDDVDQIYKCAPLKNFTTYNLMAEGILTAKKLYPKELERFKFDEAQYVMNTIEELEIRRKQKVDVSREVNEIKTYLQKNSTLNEEINRKYQFYGNKRNGSILRKLKSKLGDLGLRQIKQELLSPIKLKRIANADAKKVKSGQINGGLRILGDNFGFNDIIGGAKFLSFISEEGIKQFTSQSQN